MSSFTSRFVSSRISRRAVSASVSFPSTCPLGMEVCPWIICSTRKKSWLFLSLYTTAPQDFSCFVLLMVFLLVWGGVGLLPGCCRSVCTGYQIRAGYNSGSGLIRRSVVSSSACFCFILPGSACSVPRRSVWGRSSGPGCSG